MENKEEDMAQYIDKDKLKGMIQAKADTLIAGKEAFLYIAKWLDLLPSEDVIPRSEWVCVEDGLPERGRDYLCRCVIRDNFDYPFYMVLRYILIDKNPHFQHECDNGLKVTHWMPIPEAPKMKETK